MRAVITGGAGFLGSHLCELMLEKGWDVLCLDNLVTGNESNITHLISHLRFRFAHMDVSRYIEVQGPVETVLTSLRLQASRLSEVSDADAQGWRSWDA